MLNLESYTIRTKCWYILKFSGLYCQTQLTQLTLYLCRDLKLIFIVGSINKHLFTTHIPLCLQEPHSFDECIIPRKFGLILTLSFLIT